MAFYLYKKFIKNKNPEAPVRNDPKASAQHEPCIHQRNGSLGSNAGLMREGHELGDYAPREAAKSYQSVQEAQGDCGICKDEKRQMKHYRRRLMLGLFFPFLVQSLDVTIIAGALPFIASDFHQLSQLNWIVSAFNLTSAAFIPFWGQFADVFGRYSALQGSMLLMLLGSVLCSAAPVTAFAMLLLGRAFQGIGRAGLLIVAKAILADKVSLKENAKNNTIFTIVGGVGYGIGPVIGGYLTEASWRWCFIINIPLAVVGLVLAHFVLRPVLLGPQKITRTDDSTEEVSQTFSARLNTLDFGGQFLFIFGMGLFVLALTWAGAYYPWEDVKVIAPLVVGSILIFFFLCWEYLMLPGHFLARRAPTRRPMIPLNLLFTRNAGLLVYINLITGMAMYAVYYFVDLYFALVKDYSSGKAGVNLAYYMPGLAAGAYLAIFACNVWPLQTFFPLFTGCIIEATGITILAVAINSGNLQLIFGMLALTGVGTGLRMMPGTLHGIAYHPDAIASIVSLMSLAMTLGGTLATTIMLNIFNNVLSQAGISFNEVSSSIFDQISNLPAEELVFFRRKAQRGIVLAFWAITAFVWLGVLVSLGLGNVRIGKGEEGDRITGKGSYLGSLVKRNVGKEEVEGRG
ncbi:MFS general substrate transporter [Stipitochalara longipes BDJ]|nr:MFS general substrate transporter [Stipitochalara longipes BDJ]